MQLTSAVDIIKISKSGRGRERRANNMGRTAKLGVEIGGREKAGKT